jgi:TRAP-type C4-dicarboxylate transport system substrate-binding protein
MHKRFYTNAGAMLAGALLLAAAFASAWPGAARAQDRAMTIKLGVATINDVQHEWLKRFAAALERATDGRIKPEIYPASQLGNIPRMIEAAQLGSIQVWTGPPEFLVGVDQRFELLSAPGVFQNDQHARKTITDPEFAQAFLSVGADKGLRGISLYFYGPAGYAMRTPLRSLADFKGKKLRVLASPFQTEQMARLGATGVPLTPSELVPAIQQGTIDGAFSAIPFFTTLQLFDAAKYLTESGQAYVFSIAVVSRRWFDGLPADLKAKVLEAARQAETEVLPWEIDFLGQQHKLWTDKGGEIVALPDADRAELIAKVSGVGDDIVKTKPLLKPLWDQMLAAAKRNE